MEEGLYDTQTTSDVSAATDGERIMTLTGERNYEVKRYEHQAFHVVRLTILDEEVHQEYRHEEHDGLKRD